MAAMRARALLRDTTAEIHARLHAVPAFEALAAGTLSLAAYVALLRRLLGFHAAVEAALAAAPSLRPYGIDLAERRRSAALRADLATLGLPEAGPLAPLPPLGSAARALGCLYVVEGSTLGGRQLARGLDHLLPAGAVAGRAFLLGHGAAAWGDVAGLLRRHRGLRDGARRPCRHGRGCDGDLRRLRGLVRPGRRAPCPIPARPLCTLAAPGCPG